jgi:hypothetical protein
MLFDAEYETRPRAAHLQGLLVLAVMIAALVATILYVLPIRIG